VYPPASKYNPKIQKDKHHVPEEIFRCFFGLNEESFRMDGLQNGSGAANDSGENPLKQQSQKTINSKISAQ
jgi:hypothetical protein